MKQLDSIDLLYGVKEACIAFNRYLHFFPCLCKDLYAIPYPQSKLIS